MENKTILVRIFSNFVFLFGILFFLNLAALGFSYTDYPGIIDHLFQAVSLVTLTGYAPPDFYAAFSPSGQWIYLVLLQVDVLFYAYFLVFFFRAFCARDRIAVHKKKIFNFAIFREVIYFLLILEGTMLMPMYYVVSGTFQLESLVREIHFSLMYVVGAIGNVKVNLLSSTSVQFDPSGLLVFNLLLAIGVFVGSLGLPVLRDLIYPSVLRDRLKNPEMDWRPYTKVALFGTCILVLLSAIAIYYQGQNDYLNGIPMMDRLFTSLFLPLNARFGGLTMVSMHQFDGVVFWIFLMLILTGGGIFASTGGLNIISFYFMFKRRYGRIFLTYVASVLLLQVVLIFILKFFLPGYSYKTLASFQFNTFFNAGWHEWDLSSNGIMLYGSLIMLSGRLITFFAPWLMFLKINPANLPEETLE